MKTSYIKVLVFLFAAMFAFPSGIWAQKQKDKTVIIESSVQDENGDPIPNAEIWCGKYYAVSDADGKFVISAITTDKVVVEAEGFDTSVMSVTEAMEASEIALKSSAYMYGEKDKVNLAFRKAHKGDVISAYSTVNVQELLQNSHERWANSILEGRAQGMLGGTNIRGIGVGIDISSESGTGTKSGNALCIVDGLPRDITNLRAEDIESITVLKDVSAAVLYGTAAMNGVILINTKRGAAHKTTASFSTNFGISTPLETPKYLSSEQYMKAYNANRIMDGQSATYSDETIAKYGSGANIYRYPNNDYYSSDYVRSMKNYVDVDGIFEGGNDVAQFYANVGMYSAGGLLKFGDFKNARNNIFTVRANVDLKINDWIKTAVDGTAYFGQNNTGRGNFWSEAASRRPFEFAPLLPIYMMDKDIPELIAHKTDVNGEYLLGGTTSFTSNAFSNGYAGGTYSGVPRKFSFNNRVDFDLAAITPGLSFHTNFSFDFFNSYNQTVYNTYSVYQPTWDANDRIVALKQIGTDSRPGTQSVGNTTFQRRFGFYANFAYDRTFNDVHHVFANLIGYGSQFKLGGTFQSKKQTHLALQLNYTFNKKYMIDFSGNYARSVKLAKGHRGGFSPSVALGWVISNEDFMQDATAIDYLKLKISGGMLKSDQDLGSYYLYDALYGTSGTFYWDEGIKSRPGVISSQGANFDLTYPERREINVGLEATFFNKSLSLDFNYYHEKYMNQVVRPSTIYPSWYSIFIPYRNFEEDSYDGFDLGIKFRKTWGDFRFMAGVNMLYVTSRRDVVNEVYENDYQYHAGHPVDGTWGLEALGLFQSQQEIDSSPVQTFGTVRPGDIKYKDQNNDGKIDDNDQVYLRRWNAPFSGSLELKLGWKNFDLYILGEGRSGAKTFMENSYYWIDSTDKYSEIALDSWTSTNTSAKYPRITTEAGNNNLRRSSFWLYSQDYFRIRKVQFTYNLPLKAVSKMMMKNMSVYVDASNLVRFGKNHKIMDLNVGSEPQYRSFSIGFKSSF